VRKTGEFPRVHALPQSGQDVPDDTDARLVVLGIDHPYTKETGNAAEAAAKAIFESRGNVTRSRETPIGVGDQAPYRLDDRCSEDPPSRC
jgi:hypothetical protein